MLEKFSLSRRKTRKSTELTADAAAAIITQPSSDFVDISLSSPHQSTENLMILNNVSNDIREEYANPVVIEDEIPPFEIEKTDEAPPPTVFCAIPSFVFMCFYPTASVDDDNVHPSPNRIDSDARYKRKAENEGSRSQNTSRSASPLRSESVDSSSITSSPLKPTKFIPPRKLSSRSTAGSSVPLLSAASVSKLPASHLHTYCTHADARTFSLRCGPNYKRNGLKKPSEESFMELVGAE